MKPKDAKVFLTYDQAVKRLPKGDRVHTFVNPLGMLVGADWPREELLRQLAKYEKTIEETGAMAMQMNHGLAFNDGERVVFVATKPSANKRVGDIGEKKTVISNKPQAG